LHSYDYNKGRLDELMDVVVESGCRVFVSAVGLPPKSVVDKLHKGGVLYMNMVGHPKHAQSAINNGADILCAQGGEAGGHTGDVPTVILIPAVAGVIGEQKSAFTGKKVMLVAAGGLYNGNSLAGSLMLGASGVWIGTAFLMAEESGASEHHKKEILSAKFEDITRTTIFTGRPMHVKGSRYIREWEGPRANEKQELQNKGIIPIQHDLDVKPNDEEVMNNSGPSIMGKVAGVLNKRTTAREIVDTMVTDAAVELRKATQMVSKL
jgi:NAD(P)H-dependent flavin oxidoreductase YrpB (nitropropane dioxygenase family)